MTADAAVDAATSQDGQQALSSPFSERIYAALARPDTYPHRPARVEICETHISWVFLAGERAYKLKKPLVLDFLDYGTESTGRHSHPALPRRPQRCWSSAKHPDRF